MSDLPYVIVRREHSREWAERVANSRRSDLGQALCEPPSEYDVCNAAVWIRRVLSASSSPVSLEEIVEVLRTVDNDVRHHLRSDEIAPALLRPHAVQAVRSLLDRLSNRESSK